MNESVIIQKLIQVGQILERGELEYSSAEADIKYYLEQYAALRQPPVLLQTDVSGSLLHDIYLFKVRDYETILLGRYHDGKFYIQRGDGVKYEYEAYRVVWKRLLNCR